MKVALLMLFVFLSGTAQAADRLPKSMLGNWASELDACKEQSSELGMRVEPRTVYFYEHSFSIRRLSRLKDGTLKGAGFYSDLDGRARASITLKLLSADRLQVGETIYHRCQGDGQNAR